MKVGIFYHGEQGTREAAQALANVIAARGAEAAAFEREEDIPAVDRLVVLGGDGTVLRAARRAAANGIPLVGVNYGRLGFLTEFERGEWNEAADLVLNEGCDILQRSMLEIVYNGTRVQCLNECALLSPVRPEENERAATIGVQFDGSDAGNFLADGLIVATPTGSTAHSLSAGGSIMTPDCRTFMLTPVCPCSMRARPIAYPDSSVLTFTVLERETLLLYGDGRYLGEVRSHDALTVRRSALNAHFLTRNKAGHLRRLTVKIN